MTADFLINVACIIPLAFASFWTLSELLNVAKRNIFILIGTGTYVLDCVVLVAYTDHPNIGLVLLMLVSIALIQGFSRESLAKKLVAGGLVAFCIFFSDVLDTLFFVLIGGIAYKANGCSVTQTPGAFAIAMVSLYAIYFFLLYILRRCWHRAVGDSQGRFLWYFTLFPTSQAALVTFAAYLAVKMPHQQAYFGVISVLGLLCIAADMVMFRSIEQLRTRANAEQRAAFMEQQLSQQQTQYQQILQDAEEAARIRHDIRNQLQTAYTLLDGGNADLARKQLGGVERTLDEHPHYCANAVVNAVLAAKARVCAANKIKLAVDCAVPEEITLDGAELCSLFANLLDNAIAACEEQKKQEGTIVLQAGVSRGFLIVSCSNPTAGKHKKPVRTALSEHGWGLEILRELTEQHNGRLETQTDAGIFAITAWLELTDVPVATIL